MDRPKALSHNERDRFDERRSRQKPAILGDKSANGMQAMKG
jgi:hypothetical protein